MTGDSTAETVSLSKPKYSFSLSESIFFHYLLIVGSTIYHRALVVSHTALTP
jgi:hypothetical protein